MYVWMQCADPDRPFRVRLTLDAVAAAVASR